MLTPEEALVEGRAFAETLMTDTLHITRRSDEPATDPETGEVSYPSETIHDGKGRVQDRGTEATTTTTAGASVLVVTFTAQIPVTVPLQADDEIEVTASESDPLMVGRRFRIESVVRKTHAMKTVANLEEAP